MTKGDIYEELENLLEYSTNDVIIRHLCNWLSTDDLIELIEFIKTEQG